MSKVFVIDDSVSACVAIERMLADQGFDVVWEVDAVTALQTVEKHLPDLVICDLILPDISGFEICTSLRSNPLLDKVPVLLISGDVDDTVRQQARECDAAGVIAKPFTAARLLDEIQSTLGAVEPTTDQGAADRASMAIRERLAAELETLRGLTCQIACILNSEGHVLAGSGGGSSGELAPKLRRELSILSQLVDQATEGSDEDGKLRLTLETSYGVRLVDSLCTGYLLIVGLADSGSLGFARLLMKKAGRPLAMILSSDSLAT